MPRQLRRRSATLARAVVPSHLSGMTGRLTLCCSLMIAAITAQTPAAAQVTDGPNDLRQHLNTIERQSQAFGGPDRADLPRLRQQLDTLERESLRQSGPSARANDSKIDGLQRGLGPRPGRMETDPSRRFGAGDRTRIITPEIPTTNLDLDTVFDNQSQSSR